MPTRKARVERKGIIKVDDSYNTIPIERNKVIHTSIRLDKENYKQEEEDLYKFNTLYKQGTRSKLKKASFERIKDLDDNKGCLFSLEPVDIHIYSMSDVWNQADKLNIVSDKKLKNMINDKQLRIQFIKDCYQRKLNYDKDLQEEENSITTLCEKYCCLPKDYTKNQLASKRKQLNTLVQFINVATCERLDLTTPKIREMGVLDLTTNNKLLFYRDIGFQQKMLSENHSSRHKIRQYNFDKGEFEEFIKE